MYSLGVLSITNPTSLVRKVWFEITLHFFRRGREGLREFTSNLFHLHKDDTGREYFTMSYNEADITHHGVDSRESVKETQFYALPESDLCPVKSLKLYFLAKRNPKKNKKQQQFILPASIDKFRVRLWCVVHLEIWCQTFPNLLDCLWLMQTTVFEAPQLLC